MRDIIKAMNYQTRRDNFTIYILLFGIANVAMGFADAPRDVMELTGSGYAASEILRSAASMTPLVIMAFCARICGWDCNDKTINYELLSGHTKTEVFFGRAIPALIWSLAASTALIILPVMFFWVMNGWGEQASLGGIIARLALMYLPFIRAACESILLTFLLKNCYLAMIAGYFLFMIPFMVSMFIEDFSKAEPLSWQFTVTNLVQLFYLNSKMGFIDGKDVAVYDTALAPELLWGTVASSVLISAAAIFLGLFAFKKSDMR